MTPIEALRLLDSLIGSSDLPFWAMVQASECIEVLSDFIESGVESD